MFFKFLSHQLAEFRRGRNKARDLGARVVVLLFMLYFLLMAICVGYFMGDILANVYPDKEPIQGFYGIILYYFMIDFLVRIAVQELPTLSIQPYLILNIR